LPATLAYLKTSNLTEKFGKETENVRVLDDEKLQLTPAGSSSKERSGSAKAVVQELFLLLEEYGPVWYTEELHNRIVTALCESDD
jgi:hypothetical protein